MPILYLTDERFLEHDAGRHHPERPLRLKAVEAGVAGSGVSDAVIRRGPTPAPRGMLTRVHPGTYLDDLDAIAAAGGGPIDADTVMGPDSLVAAELAAGAGLDAVRELEAGTADVAFCAIRPPGHHATPTRPMGFCLLNNVAVTAAALADRGERVLVVDYDAHHGNGTQDIFYYDPRVVYVSLHQYPFYPGTGALDETGLGDGAGTTINVPLPAHATGDVYHRALDEVVAPLCDTWAPTWLLVSAGYDAHRNDPLTDLGLAAGDYAALTTSLVELVPPQRTVLFLEGGYDLDALALSVAATFAALEGYTPSGTELGAQEGRTSGGPGREVVGAVRDLRAQSGWL